MKNRNRTMATNVGEIDTTVQVYPYFELLYFFVQCEKFSCVK